MNKEALGKFLNAHSEDIEVIGSRSSNSAKSSGLIVHDKIRDLQYFVKTIDRFKLLASIKNPEERDIFLRRLCASSSNILVTPVCDTKGNFILTIAENDYLIFPYIKGRSPIHRDEIPPKAIIDAIFLMIDHINKITPYNINSLDEGRHGFDVIDLNFTKNNSSINGFHIFDFQQQKEIILRLMSVEVSSNYLSTLCHGDLNLSNVLITPSGIKLIDLDCMIFSTPFLDLLFYLVINGADTDSFEYALREMAMRNYVIRPQDYTIFFFYAFGWIGHVFQSLREDDEVDSIFMHDLTQSLSAGLDVFFNLAKREFHS